jgi:hypothetical protein
MLSFTGKCLFWEYARNNIHENTVQSALSKLIMLVSLSFQASPHIKLFSVLNW